MRIPCRLSCSGFAGNRVDEAEPAHHGRLEKAERGSRLHDSKHRSDPFVAGRDFGNRLHCLSDGQEIGRAQGLHGGLCPRTEGLASDGREKAGVQDGHRHCPAGCVAQKGGRRERQRGRQGDPLDDGFGVGQKGCHGNGDFAEGDRTTPCGKGAKVCATWKRLSRASASVSRNAGAPKADVQIRTYRRIFPTTGEGRRGAVELRTMFSDQFDSVSPVQAETGSGTGSARALLWRQWRARHESRRSVPPAACVREGDEPGLPAPPSLLSVCSHASERRQFRSGNTR